MLRKKISMIMLLTAWVLAAAACGNKNEMEGGQNDTALEEGQDLKGGSEAVQPAVSGFERFTAEDLEGNEVTQDIFAEYELTMINIWGTFCGPCIKEMPELSEINTEYQEKGFQVVGVVVDASDFEGKIDEDIVTNAKDIAEKTGADYIHILPTKELVDSKLSKVSAVPETIFVDKAGKQVGEAYLGAKSGAQWRVIVDELLKEGSE